jgi:phage terminase small subunit
VDRAALAAMCAAWAEMRALDRALVETVEDDEGAIVERFPMGTTAWGRVNTARQAAFGRWQQLAQRFGLTPADRARVKLPTGDKKKTEGPASVFDGPRIVKPA